MIVENTIERLQADEVYLDMEIDRLNRQIECLNASKDPRHRPGARQRDEVDTLMAINVGLQTIGDCKF